MIEIDESSESALQKKANASGISLSTLKTVYRRGVAAWNSGHRPGTTPHQWGMARVNSYVTKGKGTYHGADKDLREEDSLDEDYRERESYHRGVSDSTKKARVAHWKEKDKLSDRDPEAYEPAPGDKTAKTKESKHTKRYREMYGEDNNRITFSELLQKLVEYEVVKGRDGRYYNDEGEVYRGKPHGYRRYIDEPVQEIPHSVHINGKKWKTFGSESHANNVARKLIQQGKNVTVHKEA